MPEKRPCISTCQDYLFFASGCTTFKFSLPEAGHRVAIAPSYYPGGWADDCIGPRELSRNASFHPTLPLFAQRNHQFVEIWVADFASREEQDELRGHLTEPLIPRPLSSLRAYGASAEGEVVRLLEPEADSSEEEGEGENFFN